MALIVDPDDLSQGLETAVSDAVFTGSSGANTTITSAGSNLPTLSANDFFEVRDHSTAGNNGLYQATGSPSAASLPCTKVDGTNPADAGSEAIRTLGDNGAASEYKSVHIDPLQKRLYLIEQGLLSTDGVGGRAFYSFMKEEWKGDADLIKYTFPMNAIGSVAEELEFLLGWELRTVTSPAIQSKKLLRTAGWSEISTTDILTRQYAGIVSLGSFEDPVNDNAYYSLGYDPTDTGAAIDFTFAGPVNEAILVYEDYGVPTNLVITTNNTITKSGGASFITFGFRVGGSVTIQDAEDTGNDGTWVLTGVTADVLTVSGTPLTNNADDDTMRLAADNRYAVFPKLRVRDADPKGKTFDSSSIPEIGFSFIDNKAFRFPLSNVTDQFIDAADAGMSSSPYSRTWLRYLAEAYNREVDSTTKRNFGIVIDVGRYSQANGVSNGTTTFTSADWSPGSGEALADYAGGTLVIHEGTDQGTHTISGTPTAPGGVLTIVLTVALSGSETSVSFTMTPAAPITATAQEIYEKVQYLLRQDADIDSTVNVVTGRTADELINFVGAADVRFGESIPDNPNGGGSGVIAEGFDANDTNNISFWDNGGTTRTFPFVAAGTIQEGNTYLSTDSDPEYWMFFDRTTRTQVTDFAISGASGDTASFDSAGANLPSVSTNDYVRLTDMINEENNGIWVVTDATPTTSQFDARKVDGATVVNEGAASHPIDQNPAGSPQAIVVNDNGGSPIMGAFPGSGSVSFDFDYDNNNQGGRTPATDAAVVVKGIGLESAVYVEATGTITRSTGLVFTLTPAQERNYQNP
jgi:hypothetical protein